jgi:hypothetical protein
MDRSFEELSESSGYFSALLRTQRIEDVFNMPALSAAQRHYSVFDARQIDHHFFQ